MAVGRLYSVGISTAWQLEALRAVTQRDASYSSAMKIYSLSVIHAPSAAPCVVLATANDLSSFSFYQRSTAAEFMPFFSKTVAERTPQGQRQSIQENIYTAHVYNRGAPEDIAGISPLVLPWPELTLP